MEHDQNCMCDGCIERRIYELKREEEGFKAAESTADYLNGHNAREFVAGMARQHRTLQQSFTGLCVAWLEHCATTSFDPRNQASVEFARKITATKEWEEGKYLPYV